MVQLRSRMRYRPKQKIEQFCVCDEEMCFCTARVRVTLTYPPPEVVCPDCARGRHRWTA